MKKIASGIIQYILSFTQTQLAITLISLPILVSWGIGFSVMTVVGNFIFAPVLTLFLILSSLMLFTELLQIPNASIAYLLNVICSWWDYTLKLGNNSWIIACAKPHVTVLCVSIPIILFCLYKQRRYTPFQRIVLILGMICIFVGLCTIQKKINIQTNVTNRFNKNLYCIKLVNSNKLIVIDNGYFSQKKSVEKAIDYDLRQWIHKTYGNIVIAELRLQKPNATSFKAALHLCSLWHIDALWIPYFKNELSRQGWYHFFKLKKFSSDHNIHFVRYN